VGIGDAGVTKRRTWNLAADLPRFAHWLPAWIGSDGYPISWGHFVIGLEQIAREEGATLLRDARAGRLAQATKEDYAKSVKDLERRVDA
jgi:hypothetical protein